MGRFLGIELSDPGPVLKYVVGGVELKEWITSRRSGDQTQVERHFYVPAHDQPLTLVAGWGRETRLSASVQGNGSVQHSNQDGINFITLPASQSPVKLLVRNCLGVKMTVPEMTPAGTPDVTFEIPKATRWTEAVTTSGKVDPNTKDAYAIEDIPLPNPNPWKRNVRVADLAFLDDQGNAAAVTMDGDVWLVSGLKGDLKTVTWKRYASGLHEP
ncbi:hypothetical protein [Verrucomicrobium spinosum]